MEPGISHLCKGCYVPYLDDDDPIVRLAFQIQELLHEKDAGTVLAALASTLGATLDYATEDLGNEPPEFPVLREMLMLLVSNLVAARTALAAQRES